MTDPEKRDTRPKVLFMVGNLTDFPVRVKEIEKRQKMAVGGPFSATRVFRAARDVLQTLVKGVLRSPGTSRTLVFHVIFKKFVRKLLAQIRQF